MKGSLQHYSMRSLFCRLCLAQSNCTLAAVIEVPPLANGRMWSKCNSSMEPHIEHFAPSRCQTSSFTWVGITLRRCALTRTGCSRSSSPSTATSLNLQTVRNSSGSVHESTKWKTPLYDQIPGRIFSYTRTRSGGRLPSLAALAAAANLPFCVGLPLGYFSGWSTTLGFGHAAPFGMSWPSYTSVVPESSSLSR